MDTTCHKEKKELKNFNFDAANFKNFNLAQSRLMHDLNDMIVNDTSETEIERERRLALLLDTSSPEDRANHALFKDALANVGAKIRSCLR